MKAADRLKLQKNMMVFRATTKEVEAIRMSIISEKGQREMKMKTIMISLSD